MARGTKYIYSTTELEQDFVVNVLQYLNFMLFYISMLHFQALYCLLKYISCTALLWLCFYIKKIYYKLLKYNSLLKMKWVILSLFVLFTTKQCLVESHWDISDVYEQFLQREISPSNSSYSFISIIVWGPKNRHDAVFHDKSKD